MSARFSSAQVQALACKGQIRKYTCSAFLTPQLSELSKKLPPYFSQTPRGLVGVTAPTCSRRVEGKLSDDVNALAGN